MSTRALHMSPRRRCSRSPRQRLPYKAGLPRRRAGLRVRPGLQRHCAGGVQVEEWRVGAPPGAYDGPYWRAEWWARVPVRQASRCVADTDEGERFDDFAIRQEWWTGEALPEAKVVRRELAGVPKVEVVGLSKEKVEETLLGHDHPGPGRTGGSPEEMISAILCVGWKETAWRLDIATLVRHDACMDRRALERLGHHVVSRRVALGSATAPIWPTACSSPCAPSPTSSTACARPARAPTPCWRTSWPGPRQHRHHPGRRGTQRNRGQAARSDPQPGLPRLHRSPLPRLHRGVLLDLRRRIIAPAPDATTPETTGTAWSRRSGFGGSMWTWSMDGSLLRRRFHAWGQTWPCGT